MNRKVMKVGIMSRNAYRERTIAIASDKHKRRPGEPRVWFESIRSMAQVLSNENQELLRLIIEKQPHSLAELEALSGRRKSNLSRTLRTLERYGIVSLTKENGKLVPTVNATDFRVEFGLSSSQYYSEQAA